jgi:hypothetical protein
MTRQIKALAITHIVVGGLCICAGIAAVVVFTQPPGTYKHKAMADVGIAILITLFTLAMPGIVGGLGLLREKKWARWMLIVWSVPLLFFFPLGTLLSLWGGWALLRTRAAKAAPETL